MIKYMKVLRIIKGFPPARQSGPPKQAQRLTASLAAKGHDCTVITERKQPVDGVSVEFRDGYRIVWLGRSSQFGRLHSLQRLMIQMLRASPDVIHLHEYRSPQIEVAARIAKLKETPYVLTAHGSVTAMQHLAGSVLELLPHGLYDMISKRFVLRNASAVVAASKIEAQGMLESGIVPEQIRVIHHGVDPPSNLKALISQAEVDHPPTILFVGRISAGRNLAMLLRAFRKVLDEIQNARLVLAGSHIKESFVQSQRNCRNQLRELALRLGVSKNVRYTGWLSGDDLWRVYLTSDVLAWTSIYDNFAHALVEAAICLLPIVSTPVGVAPEILSDERGGFLVPHNSYSEMAQRLTCFLQDESLRQQASKHLKLKANDFSVDKMVTSYESLFRELV